MQRPEGSQEATARSHWSASLTNSSAGSHTVLCRASLNTWCPVSLSSSEEVMSAPSSPQFPRKGAISAIDKWK